MKLDSKQNIVTHFIFEQRKLAVKIFMAVRNTVC